MDRQIDVGIRKMDMAYWGIACTTVLSKISFPPLESRLSFHPSSLAFTLPKI